MATTNKNSTFAKTYCNFSEVYIRSNETNQAEVAEKLQGCVRDSNFIHVGVSGMQNYDFIARLRPQYAMLIDINEATCLFHSLIKEAILSSENVNEFIEYITKKLSQSDFQISEAHIRAFQEKKDFWLQDDNFQYIREMFQRGDIKIQNVNIADERTSEMLESYCEEKRAQVGSIYISNVADWLIDNLDELFSMETNIQKLKGKRDEMIVIYSDGTLRLHENNLEHHPIVQKISCLARDSFTLYTEIRKHFMTTGALTRRSQMKELTL